MTEHSDNQRMVAISVAAEIVGTNIQNLRVYERHGLVAPSRSSGGTRSYSPADIATLTEVVSLLGDGLNLAGVTRVMVLTEQVKRLERELDVLRSQA